MIVRTYKRRNRSEHLGLQPHASIPSSSEDHQGFNPIPSDIPISQRLTSKFSQAGNDVIVDDDQNNSDPFRLSFSHPSSQTSSDNGGGKMLASSLWKREPLDRVDDISLCKDSSLVVSESWDRKVSSRMVSESESESCYEKVSPSSSSEIATSHKGKSLTSAGQKLIRAESLLIKAKKRTDCTNFGIDRINKEMGTIDKGKHSSLLPGSSAIVNDIKKCSVIKSNHAPKKSTVSIREGKISITSRDGYVQGMDTLSSMEKGIEGINKTSSRIAITSTLLEAQESGEMMEHMDEVNFAMDGLSPGQPLRTRRASLISILSIFGTRQRRRLLRTHGILKPVFDAVLTVPTDDSPTALAAAAVLYLMACDGQDEDFLDSPECIRFLLKLMGPTRPPVQKERLSLVGSRLLALSSIPKPSKAEPSSTAVEYGGIVEKVKQLLSTTKGWRDGIMTPNDHIASFPAEALSSEWLVLLTFEKACLSTVVLEDNAGSVKRVGGCFKERLRELGGLDAVCELATSCFLNIRKYMDTNMKVHDNDIRNEPRGICVLLRCLKVMENVTFLSENNQKHLLEKLMSKDGGNTPRTFIAVVINTINMLSDIILTRRHKQELTCNGIESRTLVPEKRALEPMDEHKLKGNFDFDELDWSNEEDNKRKTESFKRQKIHPAAERGIDKAKSVSTAAIQNSDTDGAIHDNLLEDALLSASKVLMNLTNDNDLGCRQVAAAGGLDAMALLIANHFPSFQTFCCKSHKRKAEEEGDRMISRETDVAQQDLDLLVVILGVLVNMVEKNASNRGRLASFNIGESLHSMNEEYGIIKLLCGIFLSKEGVDSAIESTGKESISEVDAESSLRQGQKEAEDMIVEAYSALLLAFLSKESMTVRDKIAQQLPEGNLSVLVPVLERFVDFHLSLNMLSSGTHELVREVIDSCK